MMKRGIAAIAIAALVGCDEGVKLSTFGFNPEDSTEIIQKALDSGVGKLIFDKQAGPWITRPLVCPSNIEIVFEDGVELIAKRGEFHAIRDYLFRCENVSNIVIRGLGETGGTFRMWKKDYQDEKNYKKSEWRYALRLCGVENVLVENMRFCSSGGDGIVIGSMGANNSRHVTIRKCICDDNHRQGISLCSGEDILIEDTILSNTKGTPPEAGIDFEPDRASEAIANVTLRNVTSRGNSGNGYDIYLRQLRNHSKPVSLRFENCRSIGNRHGTSVCGDNFTDSGVVTGLVEFRGCTFAESKADAIKIIGTPANALDVAFHDCVVSNASKDVTISAGSSRQGPPDGITLDNLTIHQEKPRPWFNGGRKSFGPQAKSITGSVTVVTADGKQEKVAIDGKWVSKNMPEINGGRMPQKRVALPAAETVSVVDGKPGELVDLSPVALVYGGHYVFFAPKAGEVRFCAHQIDVVGNRPATTRKTFVRQILPDGKKGRQWEFKTPGFAVGEITFKAPSAGFYSLVLPDGGTRLVLDRSSVPVGVDVRKKEHIVAGIQRKPFELWFYNPEGIATSMCSAGDDYYHFAETVCDPSGAKFAQFDMVEGLYSAELPKSAASGLWQVRFSACKQPTYDWIRVDLSGVPGVLFLSPEKYWK